MCEIPLQTVPAFRSRKRRHPACHLSQLGIDHFRERDFQRLEPSPRRRINIIGVKSRHLPIFHSWRLLYYKWQNATPNNLVHLKRLEKLGKSEDNRKYRFAYRLTKFEKVKIIWNKWKKRESIVLSEKKWDYFPSTKILSGFYVLPIIRPIKPYVAFSKGWKSVNIWRDVIIRHFIYIATSF